MKTATTLNIYSFIMSPIVLRVALVALGVIIASLAGPAATYACGLNGGGCGG
jgi:hypothetical protein